ncbi:MAG: hypothetical protein V4857_29255 [Pseudomonadota bacterium]
MQTEKFAWHCRGTVSASYSMETFREIGAEATNQEINGVLDSLEFIASRHAAKEKNILYRSVAVRT